jgi:hypothetical protein
MFHVGSTVPTHSFGFVLYHLGSTVEPKNEVLAAHHSSSTSTFESFTLFLDEPQRRTVIIFSLPSSKTTPIRLGERCTRFRQDLGVHRWVNYQPWRSILINIQTFKFKASSPTGTLNVCPNSPFHMNSVHEML